jgi:hypothetical protein
MEKNNATINKLQQNTTQLNDEIRSLSDRLASLEHRISPPPLISGNTTSTPKPVNTVSTPIVIPSKTNVTSKSPFPVNPTISMIKPEIKIISIAMFPNQVKVGDTPKFSVTYQNISNKVIFQNLVGCGTVPSLHWEIYPSSSVQKQLVPNNEATCPPIIKNVQPNEISVTSGYGTDNELYQIATNGTLNVILRLNLEDGSISGIQATIQFNVNATQ